MSASKIVRLTFDTNQKVLYFNYFDSYYKSEEADKDMVKKRSDISRNVERFTVDNYRLDGESCRKRSRVYQRNEAEFCFEITSFKMMNHHSN